MSELDLEAADERLRRRAVERQRCLATRFAERFDEVAAGEVFVGDLLAATGDHPIQLTQVDRRRIINPGYHTWAEQQGIDSFDRRKEQAFWRGLRESLGRAARGCQLRDRRRPAGVKAAGPNSGLARQRGKVDRALS
jgi:hypothetical protein